MEEHLITPEIIIEICGYIRAGVDFQVAALAAGFVQDQVAELQLILSEAKQGIWKEVADDIRKASAQFEVMQLMKINAEGGAKGAQWLLDRVNPEKLKKELENNDKKENKSQSKSIFSNLKEWK